MMSCPKCDGDAKVIDTVANFEDKEVYRKRKCLACGHVFHTVEIEVQADNQFKRRWSANYRKTKNKLVYQKSPIQQ